MGQPAQRRPRRSQLTAPVAGTLVTVTGEQLRCEWCADIFVRPNRRGPAPRYCSRSHRQRAYERRSRASEEAIKISPSPDGTRRRSNSALAGGWKSFDYSPLFANIKLPDYSPLFANIKLPDYSPLFANIKLPDYSPLFANIKLPDYSGLFANVKLPDFSHIFAGIAAAADTGLFAGVDVSGHLGLLQELAAEAQKHALQEDSQGVEDARSQLLTVAIAAALLVYYQTLLTATGEVWQMAVLTLEVANAAEDQLPALSGLLFIFSIIGVLETIRRISLWERRGQEPNELP